MFPKPEMIISFLAASDDGKDSTNWEFGGSYSSGSQHFYNYVQMFLASSGMQQKLCCTC
jgi:hypothetical protein